MAWMQSLTTLLLGLNSIRIPLLIQTSLPWLNPGVKETFGDSSLAAGAPENRRDRQAALLRSYRSGLDIAGALVVHENDTSRTDDTFRHLERRRDRALDKQALSAAQGDRIDHQPATIHQIMPHERLEQITASPHLQLGTFCLLDASAFLR